MGDYENERYARALHEAEVRLWVEERELELLSRDAPDVVRSDLEAEVERLRAVVDAKRAEADRQTRQINLLPNAAFGRSPIVDLRMTADAARGQ